MAEKPAVDAYNVASRLRFLARAGGSAPPRAAESRAKVLARLAFRPRWRDDGCMADCPGMVHLAAMADGGLARLRVPGGALDAKMLRAVADAADRLGSGVVDLTNRANLQIRGLAPDAGTALVRVLEEAGFRFHGEADRRRNVLLDPFSGVDPDEILDCRSLGQALDRALFAAPWIASLSPKFSFALDGGGRSRVGATPSDVTAVAGEDGIEIAVAGRPFAAVFDEAQALDVLTSLAKACAEKGLEARAKDIYDARLSDIARDVSDPHPHPRPDPHPRPRPLPSRGRGEHVAPRFGAVETRFPRKVAISLSAPVGRLDLPMLRFLADVAETQGDGVARLAPWSGVVLAGVAEAQAPRIIDAATAAGFTPPAVATRLRVIACAGAPACERAREPAKALGAAILALAAAEPERLPEAPATLHLSACSKGCAGSAAADLLLLGVTEEAGWSLHRDASPRRPGLTIGRLASADPADILARLVPRA